MAARACKNCKWYSGEIISVCCNDASDHLADFVFAADCCKRWEALKKEPTRAAQPVKRLYRYATLLRPAGPGTVPKEGLWAWEEARGSMILPGGPRRAWSIVDYSRELTEEEIRDYELAFIGCVEVQG